MRHIFAFAFLCASFAFLVVLRPAYAAPQTLYRVTSANDADDGNCNDTHCSLREAINAANAHAGLDTINFNIAGCLCIIYPATVLPTITDPVVINGYSQSGAQPGTANNAAVFKIMLRGTNFAQCFSAICPNGLHITGGGTTVKGLVINRFPGAGIRVEGTGSNRIEGNYIGTFWAGTVAEPNRDGIQLSGDSDGNVIGGGSVAGVNVISGNSRYGVEMSPATIGGTSSDANEISGNLIGMGADKSQLGNGVGILVRTRKNKIGVNTTNGANYIAGNVNEGVKISGAGAVNNVVIKNYFFNLEISGFGNGTNAILIENGARKNKIGGASPNYIASSGLAGVAIIGNGTKRNRINLNFIAYNGDLGIDLGGDGPTPNDAGDADGGPNLLQNYPILNKVVISTGRLKGKLVSAPNKPYTIDLYATFPCDGSGYGEGVAPLQSLVVMTNGNGVAKFSVLVSMGVDPSAAYTATATDSKGNTSEFAACKDPV